MRRRLLIGIGNRLRGDDSVGPRLVESLEARVDGDLETLAVHQLTPELAAPIAAAAAVVFVDACYGSRTVSFETVTATGADAHSSFSHRLSPGQLLALSQALYGHCPSAWQLLIPAAQLGHGDELSATTTAAMAEALTLLEHWHA